MDPTFPIFVRNIGDKELCRFDNIGEMQRQLEFQDVENHEYEGWDRNGRRLSILPGRERDPIWIVLGHSDLVPHVEEVHQAIRGYGTAVGLELDVGNLGSDLVSRYDAARELMRKHWKSKPLFKRLFARF